MKKFFSVLVIFLFCITGCGTHGAGGSAQGLTKYDNTELKAQLKDAAFQPKLPTKMPIGVNETTVQYSDDNKVGIVFEGPGKENNKAYRISLDISKGEGNYGSPGNSKEVDIGGIKGQYGEGNPRLRTITWREDGISYYLLLQYNKSEFALSEKELINIAKSFK